MSSYFFGGFSAYRIEPSGRQSNHLRMLPQPGMIRRALDGEIERDLHAVRGRGVAQAAEILERAERRMDRVVPALAAADRVGAAGIVRRRPRSALLRPLRLVLPIGWIGGR